MNPTDYHTVIVNFTTTSDNQAEALKRIGDYVESFLSRQPGFVESHLHAGLDGNSIVHYARWESEADFKAAGEKAQSHPDLPALRAYQPSGAGYRVWKTFSAP